MKPRITMLTLGVDDLEASNRIGGLTLSQGVTCHPESGTIKSVCAPTTSLGIFYCRGVRQSGKKVLATILEACPLVTLLPHLKYGRC